jgi:hypothetical protein
MRSPVPATLIAVMAYWVAFSWVHFAYLNDDLVLFTLAQRLGLSLQFLGYNVYEEFSPIDHLFYSLELSISPFNDFVGMLLAGVLLLGMLLSLNWALREVGASRFRRALAVGVVGSCLPVLTVTTWWAQAVYIPTACAIVLAVVAAHLRAVRLKSLWWHAVAFCLSVAGALISERTLLTPIFLIVIDAALIGRSATWRRAIRGVWNQRYSYTSLLAISIAGAVVIAKFYYEPYPPGGIGASLRLIAVTYARWFVPALVGFWRIDGVPKLVAVGVAAASVIVAGALIVANRRNGWALMVFVAVFCTLYGFLGVGRLGIFPEHIEAADVQYMVWVLPFSAMGMGLAVLPRRWAGWWARWRGWFALGLVLAIVGSLADGVVSLSVGGVLSERQAANEYFANLRAEIPELSTGKLSVLPLSASRTVAAAFIAPYNRLATLLPVIVPGIRIGALDPGTSPVVIDPSGRLRSALLVTDADLVSSRGDAEIQTTGGTLSTADGDVCFSAQSSQAVLRMIMARPVGGSTLMAELAYTSPFATTIRFTTLDAGSYTINFDPSPLLAGSHSAVFSLDGDHATMLQMSGFHIGVGLCIESLAIVHPVVVDGSGGCQTVDEQGDVGGGTACPSRDPSDEHGG